MALEKIKPFIVDGTQDFVFGNATITGNITSNNANLGNLAVANFFSGTLTTGSQPNITSVGTLGNLSVTSNVSAGNIKTNNLLYANGSPWQIGTTTTVAGSNSQVQFNDSSSFGASANFTFDKTSNTLTVTNLVTNGSGITNITGSSVTGQVPNALIAATVYTNAQPNITSVGTLSSLVVTGNITSGNADLGNTATANYFVGSGNNLSNIQGSNITGAVSYATTANSVAGSNVSGAVTYAATANAVAGANVLGQVANSIIAGTVYTAAQPNITSTGTLTELTVTGNTTLSGANVTLGAVANLHITGGTVGQYLQTDGSGTLSWATVSSGSGSNISNGNSNVNIPSANGNVNISAVGNANVVVITGTGANITGTLNVSGTATLGNISTSGSGGNITGANVVSANIFTATANITAGNANLGNAVISNYFIGSLYGTANLATYATTANAVAGANVSGQVGNALVAGTVYTNAQPNITSVGTLTSLTATGNVTGGNLVTAGKVYASEMLNGGTGIYLSAGPAGYINFFTTGGDKASISDTGNIIASNVIANSTVFATTANISGNITSGNANLGNSAVANFFTGSGAFLTSVTAVTAATVTTNAQPNITSVGTLTTLIVGNATANSTFGNGTITSTGNISFTGENVSLGSVGNLKITGGTAGYFLSTDGAGNLSWGAASGGGGVSATGSNTQIQFNDAGSLGASANLTFDKATNVFTTARIVASNGANLGSNVANVYIGGGSNNQILKTDGSGNLSWIAQPATTITVDNFTGDGTTVAFTLTVSPTSINQTVVNYNGTLQLRAAYTVVGTTLTFSEAPVNGSLIEVTTTLGVVSGAGAFVTRSYTGNGVQSTFSVTSGCTVSSVIVTENGLVQTPTTDYTISGGTLTFNGAPANGIAINIRELAIATAATTPGITWNIASSNITMTASNGYFVDTSGGPKTMTLPASAILGDTIRINDLAGSFATNNLTIARNGHKIQGIADDLLIDADQSSFGLVYSNSTYGWKVLEL
jgi:hypothetical protein